MLFILGILMLLLFDNDQLRPRLEHRKREREGEKGKGIDCSKMGPKSLYYSTKP